MPLLNDDKVCHPTSWSVKANTETVRCMSALWSAQPKIDFPLDALPADESVPVGGRPKQKSMSEPDIILDRYRSAWHLDPVYGGSITFRGKAGGAGSRPDEVLIDGPCLAYAKLAHSNSGVAEGALEYLACRLAELVNVNVPPVGFWTDVGGTRYAISVRAFRSGLSLEDASLTPEELRGLRAEFAKAAVFHTWIADIDHDTNQGNVIVELDSSPEGRQIAFIDHAMSLSYSWRDTSPPAFSPENYYLDMGDLPAQDLAEAIRAVSEISGSIINLLIRSVPVAFLPLDHGALIERCLTRRKSELPAAFAKYVGASL